MALKVTAPLAGTAVPLSDVPDPVFAEGIVGPGVAVRPDPAARTVIAPIGGVLAKVKPHAFVVVAPDGRGVLVHLGIDTVSLGGEGFTVLAAEGSTVAAGDAVIEWDPVAVEAGGRSAICPVVALDAAAVADGAAGPVLPGSPLFNWPDGTGDEPAGKATMAERRVPVATAEGLHARPAALFVKAAASSGVAVRIAKVGTAGDADARSILAVLALDVRMGDEVVLTAEGTGADAALDQLAELLSAERVDG